MVTFNRHLFLSFKSPQLTQKRKLSFSTKNFKPDNYPVFQADLLASPSQKT